MKAPEFIQICNFVCIMPKMKLQEIKEFLDEKADYYQRFEFIQDDPISIPHQFTEKEDIECAGLLAATIAWGNRKSILRSADAMLKKMEYKPYSYILNYNKQEERYWKKQGSLHRTLKGTDLDFLLRGVQKIFKKQKNLEDAFLTESGEAIEGIKKFRRLMLETEHEPRSLKHLGDAEKGSACKRLNMYLRWMVRPAEKGVDFGIWKSINPAGLSIPLDIHSGNTARSLGILKRKNNDLDAVYELDNILRKFDKADPVKYDFALFGIGVFEPDLFKTK